LRAAVTDQLPETLPIEPSPRILQMLGHVNFEGWQCIAELVDNSIDAFLRDSEEGRDRHARRIDVRLPAASTLADGSGVVEVVDNASGMTLRQMQDAVRAGYSGNDPVGKLGLFGMGFNVSTARLGRLTEILSHREGDGEWIGIRIDVDEMVRNRTWNAPVVREPLREGDGPSGTRVRVSRIPRNGVVRGMTWGAGKPALLRRLSRLYHVAIERHGIQLSVNDALLVPWRLCLWSPDRSVPSLTWGRVPAVFVVDEQLESLPYCLNCWEWGTAGQATCYLCGGTMTIRERRIRGLLGIQRSFSIAWGEGELNHFGVDLIRNGRVIETFDKDLFDWVDPNDLSRRERDYPVDATYLGGRIVGELEVDFVPLRSYHKDSFEKADPAWSEVRRRLRGDAPLRPDIARRYGYDRPDTPLARLFDGYRKTSPAGERYLITGHPVGRRRNPREPMHTSPEIADWILGFEDGGEEFATDAKWWEAVLSAERSEVEDVVEDDEATAASPFDDLNEPIEPRAEPDAEDVRPDESPPLRTIPDPSLSVTIDTSGIVRNAPASLTVVAERVTTGGLPGSYSVSVDPRGQDINFIWDPRHDHFRTGVVHPVDALVAELAVQVMYRAQVTQREYPISHIEAEVRSRAFPDHNLTLDAAAERAASLLHDIRTFLIAELQEREPHSVELDEGEVSTLRRNASQAGVREAEIPRIVESGDYLRHMPLAFVPRCALLYPEVLMHPDGFFGLDYAGYDTEELRRELREALYVNLSDIAWLVQERANLGGTLTDLARLQITKSATALQILELRRRA
jgi:hypothetical protein